MSRTVSATEARVHFGEIIREVAEKNEPIYVDRAGGPQVVIITRETWDRLSASAKTVPQWRTDLENLRESVHRNLAGRPMPDWEEVIREMREERSAELTYDLLRRERSDKGTPGEVVGPGPEDVGSVGEGQH